MGNIVIFPLKGTKIESWFKEAFDIGCKVNFVAAKVWLKNNVPKQLREPIQIAVQRRLNENNTH